MYVQIIVPLLSMTDVRKIRKENGWEGTLLFLFLLLLLLPKGFQKCILHRTRERGGYGGSEEGGKIERSRTKVRTDLFGRALLNTIEGVRDKLYFVLLYIRQI